MRLIIASAALLVAVACSPDAPDNAAAPAVPPTALPQPGPSDKADEPLRFVGDWAASAMLCKGGRWRFRKGSLSTAGEVSCGFAKIARAPSGYDIQAVCSAEGLSAPETIKLRFTESEAAMTVASKTFQPITLIRCAG